MFFFFFFQAEDGIRDRDVTGVQTCALPILGGSHAVGPSRRLEVRPGRDVWYCRPPPKVTIVRLRAHEVASRASPHSVARPVDRECCHEITSCPNVAAAQAWSPPSSAEVRPFAAVRRAAVTPLRGLRDDPRTLARQREARAAPGEPVP